MKVQRRMTELRIGGKSVYDATGGVLQLSDQTLNPGDVGEVSEEIARAFQHKLCKPGSQVAGEPVKGAAECALDFDDPEKAEREAAEADAEARIADAERDAAEADAEARIADAERDAEAAASGKESAEA